MGIDRLVEVYRNPQRTDWGSFRTDLLGCVQNMTDRITNFIDLETAAKQFQDAIIDAYNENCPFTMRQNNRNISWQNQDLAERRRNVRRLFSAAKKAGKWNDYKRTLTDYNKHSNKLRQNHGEDIVRRLRRLQNVPDSKGFFQRIG